MVKENYSYAFPLDQSNCLEVTLKVIERLAMYNEETLRLKTAPFDLIELIVAKEYDSIEIHH